MDNSLNERFSVIGDVEVTVTDADGLIKDHREIKNLVVAAGKSWIASRMVNAADAVMSHMAIGTGTVTPNTSNTALGAQVARVALTSTSRTNNQVTYSASFPAGTGTGSITEAGIFNASSLGTMLCRTVFSEVNKDILDTLTINWTVTIL